MCFRGTVHAAIRSGIPQNFCIVHRFSCTRKISQIFAFFYEWKPRTILFMDLLICTGFINMWIDVISHRLTPFKNKWYCFHTYNLSLIVRPPLYLKTSIYKMPFSLYFLSASDLSKSIVLTSDKKMIDSKCTLFVFVFLLLGVLSQVPFEIEPRWSYLIRSAFLFVVFYSFNYSLQNADWQSQPWRKIEQNDCFYWLYIWILRSKNIFFEDIFII